MKQCWLFILIVACAIGCTAKRAETFARITERKHVDGQRLCLNYIFVAQGKLYRDSSIIENKVVPSDSVRVSFPADNPSDSKLQIP